MALLTILAALTLTLAATADGRHLRQRCTGTDTGAGCLFKLSISQDIALEYVSYNHNLQTQISDGWLSQGIRKEAFTGAICDVA